MIRIRKSHQTGHWICNMPYFLLSSALLHYRLNDYQSYTMLKYITHREIFDSFAEQSKKAEFQHYHQRLAFTSAVAFSPKLVAKPIPFRSTCQKNNDAAHTPSIACLALHSEFQKDTPKSKKATCSLRPSWDLYTTLGHGHTQATRRDDSLEPTTFRLGGGRSTIEPNL